MSTMSTEFKPKKSVALSGVAAGSTALCTVGNTGNDLYYRGYDILEFAEKARAAVTTPLMLTGGFRTVEVMADAINSGAIDFVGVARALAIEPDAPNRLLAGQKTRHAVKPIMTGIKMIDKMGLMEVAWYTRQLRRIAEGKNPKPNESPLVSLVCGMTGNGWNTFKTRRLRAS